jgi:hypothetical protein
MKSYDAQKYTTPCPYLECKTGTEFRQWSGFSKIPFAITLIFITDEVLQVEDVLIRKAREQEEMSTGRGHWHGFMPYLRLIMCLMQDNVKCLFLTRANSRSRQELDARSSDSR